MDTWLVKSGIAVCGTVIAAYAASKYFAGGVCRSDVRLDGKVIVITGGNTGIGKETAIDLARRGGKVYIACRDAKRGADALDEIKKESGSSNVYLGILDLASFDSIKSFARSFQDEESQLHILINNAGIMYCPFSKTEQGLEMQFGVNHIGHFLLTHLLLKTIKSSAPSRIINLSSLGHKFASAMDFENLNSEKGYNAYTAYFQSKLANIYFTRKLSRDLEGTGVSTFAVHPGGVKTELSRHMSISYVLLYPFAIWFMKTAKQGAQTSIYCAVEPGLEKESGKYFADCQVAETSKLAQDDGAANKLWEKSEEICGL